MRSSLWPRIAESTTAWVADLAAALEELDAAPEAGPARWEGAARVAHAIAGRAGLYGFRAEARAAALIEDLLRAGLDGQGRSVPADAFVALDELRTGFRVEAQA